MPEEYEISLIMEGNDASPAKLRLLREEWGEQPPQSNSNLRVEVIEDKFRDMLSRDSMMPNLLLEFDTCDFENCKHSL